MRFLLLNIYLLLTILFCSIVSSNSEVVAREAEIFAHAVKQLSDCSSVAVMNSGLAEIARATRAHNAHVQTILSSVRSAVSLVFFLETVYFNRLFHIQMSSEETKKSGFTSLSASTGSNIEGVSGFK